MANVSSSNGLEKRPKLRFPGFDEPWKETTLSALFSKSTQKNTDGHITNVICNSARLGLIPQREYFDKDIANSDNTSGYYIIRQNDFVYNPRKSSDAPYGPISSYKYAEDGIVSPLYLCFHAKGEINPLYYEWYFRSSAWHRYIYMSGDSGARHDRVSIKDDTFFAMPINLPSEQEQSKIASFLQSLDERIAAQERLVASLKKYKRGVTEAIFTKDLRFTTKGAPYPQWDKKYVGDICKIQTGKSNTQDETSQGSYPFYVRSPIVRKSNRYLFDCEAVLTVGDGVGTGKVFHYVTGKFDLHQRVYAMTDFKIVSGKYFYYYFSHFFYDRVMRMTAKTSVDSVRYEMIDKMTIQIPCHEEQQQIVSFLDCLEHSVIEAEKTLNLLEKLKSGCLQQLFI
ncbi:restriction endonuclease subunit S [Eubacterium sp. AF05-24]|uniref:restriction endonuclease subunit S n=1 Tax=Eubacterium sp. AF05-24 TaxID=2996995 RepID=UPI0022E74E30|nr:restriction endonuclease subunit S [Eubacterium sp. AF05-24]